MRCPANWEGNVQKEKGRRRRGIYLKNKSGGKTVCYGRELNFSDHVDHSVFERSGLKKEKRVGTI